MVIDAHSRGTARQQAAQLISRWFGLLRSPIRGSHRRPRPPRLSRRLGKVRGGPVSLSDASPTATGQDIYALGLCCLRGRSIRLLCCWCGFRTSSSSPIWRTGRAGAFSGGSSSITYSRSSDWHCSASALRGQGARRPSKQRIERIQPRSEQKYWAGTSHTASCAGSDLRRGRRRPTANVHARVPSVMPMRKPAMSRKITRSVPNHRASSVRSIRSPGQRGEPVCGDGVDLDVGSVIGDGQLDGVEVDDGVSPSQNVVSVDARSRSQSAGVSSVRPAMTSSTWSCAVPSMMR